jgi:hypothetical protein
VRGFIEHVILSMVMLEVVCFVVVAVVCLFGSLDGLGWSRVFDFVFIGRIAQRPKSERERDDNDESLKK